MGLKQNGNRDECGTFRFAGLTALNGTIASALLMNTSLTGAMRNLTAGEGITSEYVGLPAGYLAPGSWQLPQKAGRLSSHHSARGSSTATATPISLQGTINGTSSASATVAAILLMAGTSSGTSTATLVKAALGWLEGQSDGVATVSIVSHAYGELVGSITPFTELSPQNLAQAVWESLVAEYQETGTMGKALSLASSGGVDLAALAAAVLAAAELDPIHANVKEVNDVEVTGTGVEGDTWGPA